MKIVGVIPARYASTRFPGKPLADICGKPMIWWVYHQAKKVKELDDVYVATDDDSIKKVCEEFNMNVIMTSSEHQTGTDRIGEVATKVDADIYINIQGDEPIIPPEMISELIINIVERKLECLTLKKEVSNIEELESNTTVKVISSMKDKVIFFSRTNIPVITNDIILKKFVHIGIYAFSKNFLISFLSLPESKLEKVESIELMRAIEYDLPIHIIKTDYISIAVDLPEHIKLVENYVLNSEV